MPTRHVLIIVTSTQQMSPTEPTGVWLEEFAVPFIEFKKSDFHISVASIKGGPTPIDPRSNPTDEQKLAWKEALNALKNTLALEQLQATEYDAIFIPGGHGTMYDLPHSAALHRLVGALADADKPIAAMCHGPAGLLGVRLKDGTPLIAGKTVTSFTDNEETAAGFSTKMPFFLETEMRKLGARFIAQANWADHIEVDGNLITGQNPQSSKSAAKALIAALNKKQQ